MPQKVKDVVLQEFPLAGRYRVRLLKPDEKSTPILDVREYVKGDSFEGFTRRGIKLDVNGICSLAETLEIVRRMLS